MLEEIARRECLVDMREDKVAARERAVREKESVMNVAVDIPEWLRSN